MNGKDRRCTGERATYQDEPFAQLIGRALRDVLERAQPYAKAQLEETTMRVESPTTLARYRRHGPCEVCGKFCYVREPHHLFANGAGGGQRLDIDLNLLATGSTLQFECTCHMEIHSGNIERASMVALVATRECMLPDELRDWIHWLRRQPRGTIVPACDLCHAEYRPLVEGACPRCRAGRDETERMLGQ